MSDRRERDRYENDKERANRRAQNRTGGRQRRGHVEDAILSRIGKAILIFWRSDGGAGHGKSETVQELLDLIVGAGCNQVQHAALGAKDQPSLQPGAAFKIVAPKPANAQAGMKMRLAKTASDCIDHASDLATTAFIEFTDAVAKRLWQVNPQCPLPSRRCIA